MKLNIFIAAIATALVLNVGAARAQSVTAPAADDVLSQCMISHVTTADNEVLATWIFVQMARYPNFAGMTNIPDARRVSANRAMGALVNRLLVTDCAEEARRSIGERGAQALETSFSLLGQRAGALIMGQPDVAAGVGEFASYLDVNALRALLPPR